MQNSPLQQSCPRAGTPTDGAARIGLFSITSGARIYTIDSESFRDWFPSPTQRFIVRRWLRRAAGQALLAARLWQFFSTSGRLSTDHAAILRSCAQGRRRPTHSPRSDALAAAYVLPQENAVNARPHAMNNCLTIFGGGMCGSTLTRSAAGGEARPKRQVIPYVRRIGRRIIGHGRDVTRLPVARALTAWLHAFCLHTACHRIATQSCDRDRPDMVWIGCLWRGYAVAPHCAGDTE